MVSQSFDHRAFRKIIERAREAYKEALTESARDYIMQIVGQYMDGSITEHECLSALDRIHDILLQTHGYVVMGGPREPDGWSGGMYDDV